MGISVLRQHLPRGAWMHLTRTHTIPKTLAIKIQADRSSVIRVLSLCNPQLVSAQTMLDPRSLYKSHTCFSDEIGDQGLTLAEICTESGVVY